ncbi:alpha-amylase/4-alpha-glucanotransferase domain-containing protein [Singulisphaera sp. Ch08]|uniref:Alpha-amylase/4-alpha-glucanotransferase domain-containing protein n=1 Tax=Singulisphaera sp. Ch08 TaxID=3120278 RepID=A0AAU7C6K8_9BACT
MSGVRLILALHNHQPVGNFDGVFEGAYRDSYLPFLDVLEGYPEIPFALHTSGPLLEWLVERKPEYIARVRALVEAGRVEILGGGFYEPIMTMIPHRDRVGQIRAYSSYLNDLLGANIRGMWMPERVWEQHLVLALAEAGIEYTVLDDFHFQRAGLNESELFGYYLTEDEGRLLKAFPGSERLRYTIPFQEPHATYEYLRHLADHHPGSTVVFADDGEKFGCWPDTHDHVYTRGWLRRFCDMIAGNRDWIEPTTFARAVDETLPLGKIYLPDSSYREMTEWALPASRLTAYQESIRQTANDPGAERLKPFLRAGGYWRNFKARYSESDEMYARMLELSRRLALAEANPTVDPDYLDAARQELYRGQCNCPYWHGAFGGLYLPHLRNAIYRSLIASHNALDDAEGKEGPRVSLDVADFNLDARQEVRLENDRLIAYVRPATGGHIYELDDRRALTNLLATLDRRPEAYHGVIASAAQSGTGHYDGPAIISDRLVMKQEGLDRLLVYDRHPRKGLVDHFYSKDVTLKELVDCHDVERGDFLVGAYHSRVQRTPDRVALFMDRPGWAEGHRIHIRKTIELGADSSSLDVHYVLEELPLDTTLHFAVEMNFAAMAGHADDRYFSDGAGGRLGMLDTRLDLARTESLELVDEWLDLSIQLQWSNPAGLWCFPIETVSQSEGGFEGVYQSSAVIPHWLVSGDESRRWEVRIRWTFDQARAHRGSPLVPDLSRPRATATP